MDQLSDLISKYFPSEKLISQKQIIFLDKTYINEQGKITIDKTSFRAHYWIVLPNPVFMIETNKSYYFDGRINSTSHFFSFFSGPSKVSLLATIFALIISLFLLFFLSPVYKLMGLLIIVCAIFLTMQELKINSLANIIVVRKEWIISEDTLGNKQIIKWKLPDNLIHCTFANLLDDSQQKKLFFFDKLKSRLLLNGLLPVYIQKKIFFPFESRERIFEIG